MKTITMICVLALLAAVPLSIVDGEFPDDGTLGVQDSYVAGRVVNGTSGMPVMISATRTPSSGSPFTVYFNTTTDASGSFNRTVDSNSTDFTMSPYLVRVDPTYYKDILSGAHMFQEYAEEGETLRVPDGGLEATDAETGTLEVHIYNGSVADGNELSGAVVTVEHVEVYPDMPFPQSRVTDADGMVVYDNIRAVDTEVEAAKLHFRDLSETTQDRVVAIGAFPPATTALFVLEEDPWPFTTVPANGAGDANVTRGVTVDFGREMDRTSINDSGNYDLEDASGTGVPFDIVVPSGDNDRVLIRPETPLMYDSNYSFYIYPDIRSFGGGAPLWRTMRIDFTTESPPAVVSGTVLDAFGGPAVGAEISLVDRTVEAESDGSFIFPVVIPGTHTLEVLDSYLYRGEVFGDLTIERGDAIDVGTITVGSFPAGSLEVFVTSGGEPLGGAWTRVLSTELEEDEFNITTDAEGIALFEKVRAGNVNLRAGAPHHTSRIDVASVPANGTGNITIDLAEDPFPVFVALTEEALPGVASASSDLIIAVPEPVLFQSLEVSLWQLNSSGWRASEIPLSQPQEGTAGNTYLVRVQGQLPLESSFEFIVEDSLETLDDGEHLLWRDLIFEFDSMDVPVAFINGTVLLEGRALEGVTVEFEGQTAETGADGGVNLSVDLDALSMTGDLVINITNMGYALFTREVTVRGGETLQMGVIDLEPLEGWYSVEPAPGSTGVDPGTNITFRFSVPVREPAGGWNDALRVIAEGSSAPVPGDHSVSADNMTVVFDPSSELADNKMYNVEVTDDLLQENGLPFFPVGNVTDFRVRPARIEVTVATPVDLSSEEQPLDVEIGLSFGRAVNRTKVASLIDITPPVQGSSLDRITSEELLFSALFAAETVYTLSLPPGVYGLDGESLGSQFSVSFTTGTGYARDHSFTSINLIPQPDSGWEPSQTVVVTGTAENSLGYEVWASIGGASNTTTVNEDTTWSLEIVLPDSEMEGAFVISIGVPGGPAAYSTEYEVEISSPGGEDDGEEDDDPTFYYIIAAAVFILLAILIAVLYMRSQRRKVEGGIAEVDPEWEE